MIELRKMSLTEIIASVVNFTFGLAIFGLIIRFLFRLVGANPDAAFTEFIYNSTAPLLDPFKDVFTPYVIEPGNVFEFTTLLAIAMYLVIGYMVIELVSYVDSRSVRK